MREASVADVDRMHETEAYHGVFFKDFDAFEAWEAEHITSNQNVATSATSTSSTEASAGVHANDEVPPDGEEPNPQYVRNMIPLRDRYKMLRETFSCIPPALHSALSATGGFLTKSGSPISHILLANRCNPEASGWDNVTEPDIPSIDGRDSATMPTVEAVVTIQRIHTSRVIGRDGCQFKRLRDKYQVQLSTTDSDHETTIRIRGIQANVRQVKADISTIVRNINLYQFNGISVRQKSRTHNTENIELAAPTDLSGLPQDQAAAFSDPKVAVLGFDAALLNAPGFQAKLAYPLLSRVSSKSPLPDNVVHAAELLTQFDDNTTIMGALTALDHVEMFILRTQHNNNSAGVQQLVSRQRTIAFQLFERLIGALYDLPGPGRVRYLSGVDRKWNHVDIAQLFQGNVQDVVRCRVGGADLSIDGRAYVIFDSAEDAKMPAAVHRIKKCEQPQKREALCVQLVLRLRSLYAICAGMALSDQGYRHSSMQPVREARRTAAQTRLAPMQSAPPGTQNLDHVERPHASTSTEARSASPAGENFEDVSDDDADTDEFPHQQPSHAHGHTTPSAAVLSVAQHTNPFIKFNAQGVMMRPVTPLKWAAGNTPVNFWIGQLLKQHYAPGLWLKMSMMGKNWHNRWKQGELDERVVTKDGYISRNRMVQRLREIWDRFSSNDEAFRQWFHARLTYEDYLYVDSRKRRRERVLDMFISSLTQHNDRSKIFQPSLFAPPARGCYAIPEGSYLVFVDTQEALQKFVRFAKTWTATTCVAYDSEGSSSHPETIQFASGPWNEATSVVIDVPACKRLASFAEVVKALRDTEARFIAQATRHESDTLSAIAPNLRFKHLIDVRQLVYKCWMKGNFATTSLDRVESLKRKEALEHPNLTSFHYLVNNEMLSKAETVGTHWVRPLSNASLRYCHADVLCMLKTLDKCYEKNQGAFDAIIKKGGHQNYDLLPATTQEEYWESDEDYLP